MAALAEGTLSTVNDWLNQNVVPAGLVTGTILAAGGVLWAAYHSRRRLSWSVVYDAPINTEHSKDLWTITAAHSGDEVEPAHLLILQIRNSGVLDIAKSDWKGSLTFAVPEYFEVIDLKARDDDNTAVRADVEKQRETFKEKLAQAQARGEDPAKVTEAASLVPDPQTVRLPPFDLNHNTRFQLIILLRGKRPKNESRTEITQKAMLGGGRVKHSKESRRRAAIAAAFAALTLVAGTSIGVWLANNALTPQAKCASGSLQLEGSTAFSPIATIAKNAYIQQCPNAHIAISPIGSGAGLEHFGATLDPPRELAMVDGAPSGSTHGLTPKPVGVVIFAVVAHHDVAAQLNADQIRRLYTGTTPISGVTLVGREQGSGTRNAFSDTVLQSQTTVVDTTPCPAPGSGESPPNSCTASSTMQLLAYVNATPGAIGYAEADALPFFPNVDVVALDGRLPNRDQALHHAYPFVATEELYMSDTRADLTNDFVDFLRSDAMAARLHDVGYVSCSEIGGTDLSGMCSG